METQSFGVCFLIRKCKNDSKRADIYARITVDGEEKEFSTKEQIETSHWNREKGMVKGTSITVKSINNHLENIRFGIKDQYRKLFDANELVTAESLKNAYLGLQTQLKGHGLKELLTYYKKIWEPKLKNGGFKNYKTTIKYLELFLESKYASGDVYLSQVNGQFATDFEHYIRTTPIKDHDPCKGNGVGKHIQRFKRILNWAKEDLKWIKENQCAEYSCPLKKSKRKKLDIHELVALETKAFVNPSLNYIKELFLYSCYTGLAFADVMALAETDFEWDVNDTVWCKIYRTKSDELSAIPLLKSAAKILKKYRDDAKEKGRKTIFPRITNQCVNDSLKIIQEACAINTYLTFHVARHTFAKTVALKNGIPLETVQMMMGHTKITTTQIYADVDEEKIMSDMTGLEDKLEKKRAIILDGAFNYSFN
ncbi:site-specific integrase [Parafilimonas sp.]|uniref:site-specific integrase n=1 Tax=Parafilimonas sp. TaxID=1969739 RepID=UPI0039E28324